MIKLTIPAMSCGHCVKAITETITALDAAAIVQVDLPQKTVSVQSSRAETDLREALAAADYPPAP
ncbi:MAG: heavy-metal-associated domain-containing protein [Gammaproteobacteria bacterium]|nr:heavy-metal-associated domain-containing protein [Gammaproteobacteria bacterium]